MLKNPKIELFPGYLDIWLLGSTRSPRVMAACPLQPKFYYELHCYN